MTSLIKLAEGYNKFFNTFLPAYIIDSVPHDAQLPYLTYTYQYEADYVDAPLQVRLWSKSTSFSEVLTIAEQIKGEIQNGILYKIDDDSTVWIKPGTPFMQIVPDEDLSIKTVYLNLITNV